MQGIIAGVASSAVPVLQARHHHTESLRLSNALHEQAIATAETLFHEELKLAELLHRKECAVERELHLDEMAHEHDIARREGIRDVWSQRNQLMQTLMVIDTLMFSCSYSLLLQGDPPVTAPNELVQLYSAVIGISLSFLFASIWFCLKIQNRLVYFDMHRPDIVYCCGDKHRTFNEYYKCHCARLASAAFGGFYLGTAATVAEAAIFCFSKMYYGFVSLTAGTLFLVVSAVAILAPLVLHVVRRGCGLDDSSEDKVDIGGLMQDAEEMLRRVRERDESAQYNMGDDEEEDAEEDEGEEDKSATVSTEDEDIHVR